MEAILRKYGESATINFSLFQVDGVDFRADAVHASGDSVIMKDEAAEANTTNAFTDEGSGYSIVLTATEMQAARVVVYLIDQTATKVWLDTSIIIETYGHASAQHAFDLDTANVTLAAATHTGAVIPTVTTTTTTTTLTNLPAITSNWITAAGIAAGAMDGKGDWNIGKTGYSLTQTFPSNFSDFAIDVTTGTVTLKNGTHTGAVIPTVSALTGHTAQTADHTASIAAILTDTGTTLDTKLDDIQGETFSAATDSLEAIRDRGDSAWTTGAGGTPPQLLQSTTLATLTSQTVFTLTAGSADDDTYNGAVVIVTDSATSTQKAVGSVSDYVGSTKQVTLTSDPAIFTMAVGDSIDIIANTSISVSDILSDGIALNTSSGVLDTVSTVTNQVAADVTAISGGTAAADNLEATYDGTGYSDDNAPATQTQVGQLSTGSAAISKAASGATITTGGETNTWATTKTLDGVYHEITDVGGAIDFYYEFDVGGNGVATDATFIGRLQGANDDLDLFAYNWAETSWDQIGNSQGSNSTTDWQATIDLLVSHTGTGANAGKARIRAYKASGLTSATLYMDQVFISYAVVSQTVGYAQGQVWINTDEANTGTESYIDGVADNPVSTLAAAKTIADNLGMKDFHVTSNSTITLAADLNGYNVFGIGYTLDFAGFDAGDTHFYHSSPTSGAVLAASGHVDILDSIIHAMTVNDSHFTNCSFTANTVTFGAVASDIKVINCRSVVAGSGTPKFDFGTSAGIDHYLTIANWQNGIEIENFNSNVAVEDRMSMSGTGQLVIAASCAGGTINLRGQWKITDNSGGAVTVVYDGVAQSIINIEADTNELQTNQGNWATATGFATEAKQDAMQTAVDGVPTTAEFEARTLVSADYFDAAADTVANVTTAGSVSGTVGGIAGTIQTLDALDTAQDTQHATTQTAVADVPTVAEFEARTLTAAGYFNPATDTVANVTTTATTTTNTDMRGTDSAALASVATEARLSELDQATAGKMANQVDIIQTDTTTEIPGLISDLNDLSAAEILTTQLAESYAADGTAPTLSQAIFLIQQMVGDFSISGTTITTKKLDGTTTAATFTLDDATSPTSKTRAT